MTLLAIENLHVAYGAIKALQGVSVSIEPGEIVALIGANGAGKTTLLRTISGLLRPQAGTIRFDGAAVLESLRPDEIVRLGISQAPEGRQVFAGLSVEDNLRIGAYQRRDRAAIERGIERCNSLFPVLAERRRQKAGTLSGGEQQMLVIGRALMARPRLLLLDEPSLGLAPLIVRTIFRIIREINAEGTTIFLVEQNARMALSVAHRGYVLQTGLVLKSDRAASLLADPEVTKAYLGG